MKRGEFRIRLAGPTGDKESWLIRVARTFTSDAGRTTRFKKGEFGNTDWIRRIVTINSRLRSFSSIYFTLLHEIVHVTAGQNGSEELASNVEYNFHKTRDKFIESTAS